VPEACKKLDSADHTAAELTRLEKLGTIVCGANILMGTTSFNG